MSDAKVKVRKVALAGATGVLGSHILEAFISSGRYSLTILTRSTSHHDFASSGLSATTRVVEVEYDSFDSLRCALEGHDVLVSALGKTALASQPLLIDAAVAAQVKRIIPSEFGGDLRNMQSRQFPTYGDKVKAEEQLEHHRSSSGISYTFIFNNVLLDWGLEGLILDRKNRTVRLYDGGKNLFSTTSMATVARAVVAVLDNYQSTSNRSVYIQDIAITQSELVQMAQEETADDEGGDWTVTDVDTAQLEAEATSDYQKGLFSHKVFYGFAVRAAFAAGYGGHFQTLDNDLLGIRQMEKKELRQFVRKIVRNVN